MSNDVCFLAESAQHSHRYCSGSSAGAHVYPDPILFVARQMGVSPEACLMIGDTTVDMRAGRAAGAITVGVLCGFGQEVELLRAGADLILPTTSLIIQALNL